MYYRQCIQSMSQHMLQYLQQNITNNILALLVYIIQRAAYNLIVRSKHDSGLESAILLLYVNRPSYVGRGTALLNDQDFLINAKTTMCNVQEFENMISAFTQIPMNQRTKYQPSFVTKLARSTAMLHIVLPH